MVRQKALFKSLTVTIEAGWRKANGHKVSLKLVAVSDYQTRMKQIQTAM